MEQGMGMSINWNWEGNSVSLWRYFGSMHQSTLKTFISWDLAILLIGICLKEITMEIHRDLPARMLILVLYVLPKIISIVFFHTLFINFCNEQLLLL